MTVESVMYDCAGSDRLETVRDHIRNDCYRGLLQYGVTLVDVRGPRRVLLLTTEYRPDPKCGDFC